MLADVDPPGNRGPFEVESRWGRTPSGLNSVTVLDMATPVGPYTPIVRSGDLLFVSGQVGIDAEGLVAGGIEAELRQAISNLRGLLEGEGAALGDVVKTTVFLVDMSHYATMNEAYIDEFGDHRPARSAVAVAELPIGACVEVEAIARAGSA